MLSSDQLWVSVWIIFMQENQTSTHCTGNCTGSYEWISQGEEQRKHWDLVPRLLTSNQNHLINLSFQHQRMLLALCSLYSGGLLEEGSVFLQWEGTHPSGGKFAPSVVILTSWRSPSLASDHRGSLMEPLSHSPPQRSICHCLWKLLLRGLEVSVMAGGTNWTWSDAQEKLLISV